MKRLARLFRPRLSSESSDLKTGYQRIQRELDKAGADLSKPTDLAGYLYTATEDAARAAAAELERAGYSVEVKPAATGTQWLALGTIQLPPSQENIALLSSRFEAVAARVGGEYDGWEAAVRQ